MNADALFTRAAAAALPEDSKERALATATLRRLWHAVFDPCPELARRCGDKNREFLDPFLEHAARRNLSMRWTLHAHLLLWTRETLPAALSSATAQELLAAAAARWANEDQSDARGMLIYDAASPGSGLAAWKLKSVSQDVRVVLIGFPAPKLASPGISCAPFAAGSYPDVPSWRPLPD